jgi:hypothetical protein
VCGILNEDREKQAAGVGMYRGELARHVKYLDGKDMFGICLAKKG